MAGPRVLFCSDSIVDLMLKSGASQYIEFKSIDASFIYSGEGELSPVPDTRSAIFRDSSLSLSEKTRFGSFFKLVEAHLRAEVAGGGDENVSVGKKILEEDLESPFTEFLNKMRLSAKIKSIILYAIAMVDYDQDIKLCKHVLKTKDGIERLALYHSSVGRFSNALGAMIYPIYGQGELPQAFCRRAAVKGCLYVLRMPVTELLMDEDNGSYKGVKGSSGQELFSQKVVLGPSFVVSESVPKPSQDVIHARIKDLRVERDCENVARGIFITNKSLMQDVVNHLVIYPPKSLHPEQATSVRVLQIGSNLAVCPSGMFVVYISSLCYDAALGKKSLHAALDAIFSVPVSEAAEHSSSNGRENTEMKPTLIWSALYIQEILTGSLDTISTTSTPDGNLNYNDLIAATKEQYFKMFPDVEFFPEASFVNPEDDEATLDQNHEDDSTDS